MKLILFISLIILISSGIELFGIDLSSWDDVVYWDVLKTEVKFVILRAGYGTGTTDTVYEDYYAKCKQYNIPVGAYWYSYATTVDGAEEEARAFLQRLKGKKFEYPVYYDIEEEKIYNTGKNNISNMLERFCTILEENGYYCGIYGNKYSLTNFYTKSVLNRYDIWLAHYTKNGAPTDYVGHRIWQYTDSGTLKGKPGDCDLNWSYENYPALIKAKHFNGY